MFASVLLNSDTSHNFIAAPQVIKFRNSVHKSFLYSAEFLEVYLAENSSIIYLQIMQLPLQFADGVIYTVEVRVVPALNYAIILGMPFLYTLNPNIDWKTHTITWYHSQLTSVLPALVLAVPSD